MHTRASDGGIFYIGIGDIKRPFKRSNRTKFWKHIVNKHGYNIQIIAENLTWENACDLEKKYIAFYGRRDKNQGCLVNLTDGGDGVCGFIHSEEARKKISEANKGKIFSKETLKKISEANTGKKRSQETLKKLSEAHKGKIFLKETLKKLSEANKGNQYAKGRKHSEEARKKMSEMKKICWIKRKQAQNQLPLINFNYVNA